MMVNVDSRALESFFKVHGAGGLICPICRMRGEKLGALSKVVYDFEEILLPLNHVFRMNPLVIQIEQTQVYNFRNVEEIKPLLPHCFPRISAERTPQTVYTKVQHETVFHDAIEVEKKREKRKHQARKNQASNDKLQINGVKGLNNFFLLPYFSWYRMLLDDPFHSAMNVSMNTLLIHEGKRGCGPKLLNYCRQNQFHPLLETEFGPWTIDEKLLPKITTWVNCLLAPRGHRSDFQVKHIYSDESVLRGTSKIDFMCNLMDYCLAACPGYNAQYRIFFNKFSNGMCDLLSTKINKAEYPNLCLRIIELVALHNRMIPHSESLYIYHQLIDIVHDIKNFGPTRNSTTLANETNQGSLKGFLKKGGSKPEFTTISRFVQYSMESINKHYSFQLSDLANGQRVGSKLIWGNAFSVSPDEQGYRRLHYTDEAFFLFQPCNKGFLYNLTMDETTDLFETLRLHILDRSNSIKDALQNSFFYRLFTYYDKIPLAGNRVVSLHDWMEEVIAADSGYFPETEDDQQNRRRRKKQRDLTYFNISSRTVCDDDKIEMEIYDRCKIYREDVPKMEQLINNNFDMKYKLYEKAYVYGTGFISRGFAKREVKKDMVPRGYGSTDLMKGSVNEANILNNHWSDDDDSSSWCKYYNSIDPTAGQDKPYSYGQINAFLQIEFPLDPFIDGVCLASVTSRMHKQEFNVDFILGDNDSLTFSKKTDFFVPVANILSTPIIICGFYTIKPPAPIVDTSKFNNDQHLHRHINSPKVLPIFCGLKYDEYIKFPEFVAPRNCKLHFLALIEMNRKRRNAKYRKEDDSKYRSKFEFHHVNNRKTIIAKQMVPNRQFCLER